MFRRQSLVFAGLILAAVVSATPTVDAGEFWRNSPLNAHLRFWSIGVGAGYHAGNGWRPHGHALLRQPQCPWDDTPCDVARGVSLETEYWRAQQQSQLRLDQ